MTNDQPSGKELTDKELESLKKCMELIDKFDKQWADQMPPLTATLDEETDTIYLIDPDGRPRLWMPAEVYVDILKYNEAKDKS